MANPSRIPFLQKSKQTWCTANLCAYNHGPRLFGPYLNILLRTELELIHSIYSRFAPTQDDYTLAHARKQSSCLNKFKSNKSRQRIVKQASSFYFISSFFLSRKARKHDCEEKFSISFQISSETIQSFQASSSMSWIQMKKWIDFKHFSKVLHSNVCLVLLRIHWRTLSISLIIFWCILAIFRQLKLRI